MNDIKKTNRKKESLVIPLILMVLLALATVFALDQTNRHQGLFSQAQGTNCDVPASELAMTASEQQLLKLINDYRAQNGAPAMESSPTLKKAAEWLSNHMGTGGPFSHTDSLGRSSNTRMKECGFTGSSTAENIAYNQDKTNSAAKTFDQWKNSAGHNKIMLTATYTQVGIAEKVAPDGKNHYWTLDAASGKPSGTVPTAPPPTQVPPTAPPQPTSPPPLPTNPVLPTAGQQPTSPPQGAPTPTFACLGGCVTPQPTDEVPVGGTDPINNPDPGTDPGTGTTNPPTGGTTPPAGGEANNGLLAILIQLIIIILQLIGGRG